jgi:hypothetical protein
MKKFDPYHLPGNQIWTDIDLVKFMVFAFIVGLIIGVIL